MNKQKTGITLVIKWISIKKSIAVSRRKIIKIMKINRLISLYNKVRYKHKKQNYNEQLIDNRLNRKFNRKYTG